MQVFKRTVILFLLFSMLLSLCACSKKQETAVDAVETAEPTPTPTPEPTPTPTPEPTPEPEIFYDLYGIQVSNYMEEIDLTGIPVEDGGAAVEALIPSLTNVKKIIMSDCGLSNEEMDALNQKYEDIRFVWTVYFGASYYLRTDETTFIGSLFKGSLYNYCILYDKDVECLKYCTDMVALDIGHQYFTNCEFCAYMPHLKYLILAEVPIMDLSPLAGLQELEYAELFMCNFKSLAPLLECPNLKHLNLCWDYCTDNLLLCEMKQLERLWYISPYLPYAELQEIIAALPDTEIEYGQHGDEESTGYTWREHDIYFEMRDTFGVYYLPGGAH